MQSGISRLAPPEPESRLQSLPPILRNTCQVPIPSCSKGPRGLSVLPRVTSIFTRIAISPSPQLRQCPSRYAIRAGRNLPDKEFRSSAPHVAMGEGPSLQLSRRGELAGVWPLRIPGTEMASGGSSFAVPELSAVVPFWDMCSLPSIIRRISRNFRRSSRFVVISGIASKNGLIRWRRSANRKT